MRLRIAILAVAACLGLAACGGDDDSGVETTTDAAGELETGPPERSEPPEAAGADDVPERGQGLSVEEVVELVLTSGNPEDACLPPHVTSRYVESAYGGEQGCLQALRSGGVIATSIAIESVDESAEAADVTAVAKGGPYAGETVELELVKRGGNWSVDRVEVDVPAGP